MKRCLMLLMVLTAAVSSWAQTIYTADNNPGAIGGANIFTGPSALQDAVAAASATDIIHIVRSSTDYGTTTIDKQLTLYGIGLNPDTDGNERSIVSQLNISEPVSSGTRVSGLYITTILNLGGNAGSLSNLLIENSWILRIQHTSSTTTISNLIIRNNALGSGLVGSTEETIDLIPNFHSNVIIANNIIYGAGNPAHGFITANNGTSVENNIFISGPVSNQNLTKAFEQFNGNTVKNNIFFGVVPSSAQTIQNNTFENNLSFICAPCTFLSNNGNTSTNNLENEDPLMANVPRNFSIDFAIFNPTLNATAPSPAIGTGEGGTDMGVFGGATPMALEGTLIPTIQSLTFPTTVVKGDSLAVQIKAKGN